MSEIKPPGLRRNRRTPIRGEFHAVQAIGWQHGEPPEPPPGLSAAVQATWRSWFGSWVAAHWRPSDVPQIRTLARIVQSIELGDTRKGTIRELRMWLDGYGLTPKGQADRRWMRPLHDTSEPPPEPAWDPGLIHLELYPPIGARAETSTAPPVDSPQSRAP